MTRSSYYKLACCHCNETIQLEARDGSHHCPNGGAILQVDWHGDHGAFDQQQREAQHT